MVKKNYIDPNQLGFEFAVEFDETVSAIQLLQIEENEDVDRRIQTTRESLQYTETRNNQINPDLTLIQSSGLENSGQMGDEQPRQSSEIGERRGNTSSLSSTRTTSDGNADPRVLSGAIAGWHDRARNIDAERHQYEPLDYVITENDNLGKGNARAKYKDNIEAISTLIALRQEKRHASPEEQQKLVKYVGWGGLPQVFDQDNKDWQKEFSELSEKLTEAEYQHARRSTQDAHYTSQEVIQGIYQGLEKLGVNGGKMLEPSSGIGHFIGLMPPNIKQNSEITTIELDPITSKIGQYLYPKAIHINKGFQDILIPSNHFDVCIGNPPFGNQTLHDTHHPELNFSIHNYFLAKSIDKIKEGGIMAVVVSRYFLDSSDKRAREHIAKQADLVGAIRLPNTAFKENALTNTITDILFFQKNTQKTNTEEDRWIETNVTAAANKLVRINQYFIDNPQQIAGTLIRVTNQFGDEGIDVISEDNIALSDAISKRLAVLPTAIFKTTQEDDDVEQHQHITLPDSIKVGAFFITEDDKLARRLANILDEHKFEYIANINPRREERIRGLIAVRDTLQTLINLEQVETSRQSALDEQRSQLNHIYDDFVKKYGFISSQANRLAMSEDPQYPLLFALEKNYDKGISREMAQKQGVTPIAPSAEKADIFTKRVISPQKIITHVDNAKDALIVSLNTKGKIDIPFMIKLSGKDIEQLTHELSGLIYRNPSHDEWETADHYLSGNVKEKLKQARHKAESHPEFEKNVRALETVQPADIEPIDIAIQLGSTWVPDQVMNDFVKHLFKNPNLQSNIIYQKNLSKWFVEIPRWGIDNTLLNITWGIDSYPAHKIVEAILTNKSIQVRKEIGEGQYKIDEHQTTAANQKADEVRQAFLDWVWEDKARRETLAKIYNDTFNTNVPAKYHGEHLTLPSSSLSIQLRPHQKDAIWRGIQEGTALFDHVVGAGKTLVCVGTIMESRRMGLMKKPMVIVPNHLLFQWKDAFYSLYPNANILVADKNDFKKENREKLFSRITTGDWDAVIIGHSSFKKIAMPQDTLNHILNEQVDDLTKAIEQLKRQDGNHVTVKQMEKTKEKMKEKMLKLADSKSQDNGSVSFDNLGVDALFTDESHEFKNLMINTSLNRVSGLGNLTGSEKAFDLFVKCRYLQQKNNKGVFFMTGTPISNTIAEMYTVQRYLQYDMLKEKNILHFDAWASTFGQVVTGWELDATGVNYRLNSRFSKFQNVPELISLYRTFADVITTNDLNRQAQQRGVKFPIPKIKTGKPQNIIVERSEQQARYMGVLETVEGMTKKEWNKGSIISRMENLPDDPSIDNPLKITNDARKAGLDFRLIDGSAADVEDSKINVSIKEIMRIYHQWHQEKGTQLVFCDLSTPKQLKTIKPIQNETTEDNASEDVLSMDELLSKNTSFSVYDDIKRKLIKQGIPEKEIRFIHEATTDIQKAKLFDEVNKGEVRILLGSTTKMGAGTNVQSRLVALHHLDAPWRPSDLEQREGRILRQGNQLYEADPDNFEVEIIRYATKQTYDSRMWQTIEYKAAGIEQFRKGDSLQRVIEDITSEAANAAEMKAAATGNTLIFTQVKIAAELRKIEALFANFKRNQHSLEVRFDYLKNHEDRTKEKVQGWRNEIALRDSEPTKQFKTAHDTYQGTPEDNKKLLSYLTAKLKQLKYREPLDIGVYRGLNVKAYLTNDSIEFHLNGNKNHKPSNLIYSKNQDFSATGFLIKMDNFLATFEEKIIEVQETGEREKKEYQQALIEHHKPFAQLEYLQALRKDALDVMSELKRMQEDDNYTSSWTPQSEKLKNTPKPSPQQSLMAQLGQDLPTNKPKQDSQPKPAINKPYVLKW